MAESGRLLMLDFGGHRICKLLPPELSSTSATQVPRPKIYRPVYKLPYPSFAHAPYPHLPHARSSFSGDTSTRIKHTCGEQVWSPRLNHRWWFGKTNKSLIPHRGNVSEQSAGAMWWPTIIYYPPSSERLCRGFLARDSHHLKLS